MSRKTQKSQEMKKKLNHISKYFCTESAWSLVIAAIFGFVSFLVYHTEIHKRLTLSILSTFFVYMIVRLYVKKKNVYQKIWQNSKFESVNVAKVHMLNIQTMVTWIQELYPGPDTDTIIERWYSIFHETKDIVQEIEQKSLKFEICKNLFESYLPILSENCTAVQNLLYNEADAEQVRFYLEQLAHSFEEVDMIAAQIKTEILQTSVYSVSHEKKPKEIQRISFSHV